MGAVYEAKHALIGKRVAVKVLLEKFHAKSDFVARLLQEARLASSIGHQNIVDVTDFGTTDDGRSFVVMEFLDGESLADLERREAPLPIERSLRIARQAASALGAAHAKGIFHRDVKPENLYLVRRGDADFVKVVDFGISKAVKPGGDDGAEAYRLTHTGLLLGTPLYMSPEQARGDEDLDHRRRHLGARRAALRVPHRRGPVSRQQLPADHLAGADPRAAFALAAAPGAGDPRCRRRGGDARDGEGSRAPLPDDGGAGAGSWNGCWPAIRTSACVRRRWAVAPAVRAAAPKRWPLVLVAVVVLAAGVTAALRRPAVAVAPGPTPRAGAGRAAAQDGAARILPGAAARSGRRAAGPAVPQGAAAPRAPPGQAVGRAAVQRGDERIGQTRRAPAGLERGLSGQVIRPTRACLAWWWRSSSQRPGGPRARMTPPPRRASTTRRGSSCSTRASTSRRSSSSPRPTRSNRDRRRCS